MKKLILTIGLLATTAVFGEPFTLCSNFNSTIKIDFDDNKTVTILTVVPHPGRIEKITIELNKLNIVEDIVQVIPQDKSKHCAKTVSFRKITLTSIDGSPMPAAWDGSSPYPTIGNSLVGPDSLIDYFICHANVYD